MGKVANEHEVVRRRIQALDPDRGVIVGREGVSLLDIGLEHSAPDHGRLVRPRLARVDDARHPHSQLLDRVTCDPRDILDAPIGKRSLRVLVLGLGLPVLNQVEPHRYHRRARTRPGNPGRVLARCERILTGTP